LRDFQVLATTTATANIASFIRFSALYNNNKKQQQQKQQQQKHHQQHHQNTTTAVST